MNKKRVKIVLLTMLLLFIYGLYENILNRPFPFISMRYNSYEEFNQKPNLLDINISLDINSSEKERLKAFIFPFKKSRFGDLEDDIRAVTLATRGIMSESNGTVIRKISEVISNDKSYLHICSESSKIFTTLMQSIGYPSRVIWLSMHTVSEIYTESYGWILVDTFGNVVFKDDKGRYKSLLEVNANFNKLTPFNIVEKKYSKNADYLENDYIYRKSNVFNDNSLFVVIDGKSLGNFHTKTRDIRSIVDFVVFQKPFAKGIQYVKENNKKVGNVGVSFYKRF